MRAPSQTGALKMTSPQTSFIANALAYMERRLTPEQEALLDTDDSWTKYKALVPRLPVPTEGFTYSNLIETYKKLDEEGVIVTDDYITEDGVELGLIIQRELLYNNKRASERLGHIKQWRIKNEILLEHAKELAKRDTPESDESFLKRCLDKEGRRRFDEEEKEWMRRQNQRYLYSRIYRETPGIDVDIIVSENRRWEIHGQLEDLLYFADWIDERHRLFEEYKCYTSLHEMMVSALM